MGGGNSKKNTEYYDVTLHELWTNIANPLILDRSVDNRYTVIQQFTLSAYLQNNDHYEPQLLIASDEILYVPDGSNLFIDINVINNGYITVGSHAINTPGNSNSSLGWRGYITVGGLKEVSLSCNPHGEIYIYDGSILEFNNARFVLKESTINLSGTLLLNNSQFSITNATLAPLDDQYGKVLVDGIPFGLGDYNTPAGVELVDPIKIISLAPEVL